MVVRVNALRWNARLVAERKMPFFQIDDLAGELT
jgi:hypothetical protein